MSKLEEYRDKFRNIKFERQDGILEMRLHTNGAALKWAYKDHLSIHAQLGEAFYRVGRDTENTVIIITGSGDEFMTHSHDEQDKYEGKYDVAFWDRMAQEGRDMLTNYLEIGTVVISAVNGPATYHAEIPTMADVVIASETTVFADPHMAIGAVPGDGVHVWWPMVLGPNRGRSFLLTHEHITAQEALRLGFVAEVVPPAAVLPRAWEIARKLAKSPALALRYAHTALTQEIKRRVLNDLHYGFALESLAALRGAS